jgi:hypothetical protein
MTELEFPMQHAALALALLLGSSLGANALATQDKPADKTVDKTFVTAKSLDTSASKQGVDTIALQAINDAAAAAVIGALATQLDGDVQFKLGTIDSSRVSLRDMALDGHGLVRLDGDSPWMPIRFQALYDTDTQTVESPAITFVGEHAPAQLDKAVAKQLDVQVDRKLAAEFAQQPVAFDMDTVGVVGGDARYAVVQGDGVADFAAEGKSDITVQGIYDRVANTWLEVDYQLGAERTDLQRVLVSR